MTIYEIKRRVQAKGSHFFDAKTMKHFHQTLRSFKVTKLTDTTWLLSAPVIIDGKFVHSTAVMFDSSTDTLTALS